MSTDVRKQSALQQRTNREALLAWDNLTLWIALILVVLGFVPAVRPVIGYSLAHIGVAIHSLGSYVVEEEQLRSQGAPNGFPFKWALGLAVLALPAIIYRFGYIWGWSDGMSQAQSEARDYHSHR